MKGRVILLEAGRRSRAALIVDGRLEDLILDADDATPMPGQIYHAKVDRLVPKMGGAFLRLAPGANGFLREAKGLREGDGVLVQVVSCPETGKAVPVTRRLLFKGRCVICSPGAPGINVSRRIREPEERKRLTETAEAALGAIAGASADDGFILRSAADGAPEAELAREIASALATRDAVLAAAGETAPGTGPAMLAEPAWRLALREWTDPLPQEIVTSPELGRMIRAQDGRADAPAASANALFCAALADRVETVRSDDLFAEIGAEDEIARLGSARVELPSGGWLMVEPTAALVAIDVNTGGDFSSAAGLKANIEAAREIPRQLRLRGLGGQVLVDFAPIGKKDRRRLEDTLKAALKKDPIETSPVGWTGMGLFELQRKRERRPLSELL